MLRVVSGESSAPIAVGEDIRVVVTPDFFLSSPEEHLLLRKGRRSSVYVLDDSCLADACDTKASPVQSRVPFSALCSISVLPRSLGPCEEWVDILLPIVQSE